jgi:hypothetical protein
MSKLRIPNVLRTNGRGVPIDIAHSFKGPRHEVASGGTGEFLTTVRVFAGRVDRLRDGV